MMATAELQLSRQNFASTTALSALFLLVHDHFRVPVFLLLLSTLILTTLNNIEGVVASVAEIRLFLTQRETCRFSNFCTCHSFFLRFGSGTASARKRFLLWIDCHCYVNSSSPNQSLRKGIANMSGLSYSSKANLENESLFIYLRKIKLLK